jgi:hypothetical protein
MDALTCLDADIDCRGPVEYRMALSGTGRSFPRCEHHWSLRLDQQEENTRRYPMFAPDDFDPAYAGESWDAA